jgi:hypothetical protein
MAAYLNDGQAKHPLHGTAKRARVVLEVAVDLCDVVKAKDARVADDDRTQGLRNSGVCEHRRVGVGDWKSASAGSVELAMSSNTPDKMSSASISLGLLQAGRLWRMYWTRCGGGASV